MTNLLRLGRGETWLFGNRVKVELDISRIFLGGDFKVKVEEAEVKKSKGTGKVKLKF